MDKNGMMDSDDMSNMMNSNGMMDSNNMMGMMSMMHGNGMMDMHDSDDIEWMKTRMKEYMNLTDEEINEMTEHCPMMHN